MELPTISGTWHSLFINFSNIDDLYFNFHFVDHYLSTCSSNLLLLTETMVFGSSDNKPNLLPSPFLHLQFSTKGINMPICSMILIAVVSLIQSLPNILSYASGSILLLHSSPMYICYLTKFFDYLNLQNRGHSLLFSFF